MLNPALFCRLEDMDTPFKATQLFVEKSFFNATFVVLESILVSPHHISFKCISSHFKGLKLKNFPEEHVPGPSLQFTNANAFEVSPPPIANLLRNSE